MFGKYWWVIPCLIAIGFTVRYYLIKRNKREYSKSLHLGRWNTEHIRQILMQDPVKKEGEAYIAMVFSWWFLAGCVVGHFI